jgi:hypothetical protein
MFCIVSHSFSAVILLAQTKQQLLSCPIGILPVYISTDSILILPIMILKTRAACSFKTLANSLLPCSARAPKEG